MLMLLLLLIEYTGSDSKEGGLTLHIIHQGCTRNGTEPARGPDFGTDRPSQDRDGDHIQPDQTRPDWPWRGTERKGFMRNGTIFGLDRTGPDRPGPDRTGPDRTGPNRMEPNRRAQLTFGGKWTRPMQLIWTRLDQACQDWTETEMSGSGPTRYGMERNGTEQFRSRRKAVPKYRPA